MTFGVRMNSETAGRWANTKARFRRGPGTTYRKLQSLKFLLTRDHRAVRHFLRTPFARPMSLAARLSMLAQYMRITHAVRGYHTLTEILTVTEAILKRINPVVVEAGAGSGSSTAKLSIATRAAGGRLLVFDSFQGIPENDDVHHLLDGRPLTFRRGAFRGRLTAVKKRVAMFGAPEVCTFHKGWFEDTLPAFDARPDVVLLDVDLLSSTKTCVREIMPRLKEDGILFSQDGHIREIVALFLDEAYWRDEVGIEPPAVERRPKLLALRPRGVTQPGRAG
ncbi:MAG: class I SAM-dependent methyltransferase [Deltaproteobacteria bacterium]|nr:class I SAM-dependent methyltransferase [Deltaproteobacteria bacterium]